MGRVDVITGVIISNFVDVVQVSECCFHKKQYPELLFCQKKSRIQN